MRRFGLKILILSLGLLGLLKAFETQLTFPLDPTPVAPSDVGLRGVEVIEMPTADGETVIVWHKPAAPLAPHIVYFPGNAGNLGNRAQRFQRFEAQGIGWTALAYRGSTGSTGSPSEPVLMADARLLIARVTEPRPAASLIYYGESLGTGIAVQLAAAVPPRAVILEAPYRSLPDAALYGIAPASIAVLFNNQFNTLDHIASVTAPLLILHGTDDEVIPFSHGQAVFDAAASPDKTFMALDGIGHANVWTAQAQRALWQFLRAQ